MTAKSRVDLNSDADTALADNTSGDISPEDVRQRVKDLADSTFNLTTDTITDVPGAGTAAASDTGDFAAAAHTHDDRYFTETELGATTNGNGASLIGIEDSGGLITATDVEGALAEIAGDVAALDAAVILKGTWDASAGSFPGSGAAQAGWSYIVSVGGTVDSVVFVANDRIVAIADNASTTTFAANWHKLDYTDQVLSVNSQTGAVVLDPDDLDDTSTTNKFTTTAEISKLAGIETAADVTDAANVAAAGAAMLSAANVFTGKNTFQAGIFQNTGFFSDTFVGNAGAANFGFNQEMVAAEAATPEIGAQFTISSGVGTANKTTAFKIAVTASVIADANSANIYGENTIVQGHAGTYKVTGSEIDLNNVGAHANTIGAATAAVGYESVAAGNFESTVAYWATAVSSGLWTYGFAASKTGVNAGIKTATFYDAADAATSLLIAGSHTNGIDLSGATISGAQLLATGFQMRATGWIRVGATGTAANIIEAVGDPAAAGSTGFTVRNTASTLSLQYGITGGSYTYHGATANAGLLYAGANINIVADGASSTILLHTGPSGTPAKVTIDASGNIVGAAALSTLANSIKTGTSYTVSATDSALVINPSGAFTLTLPSAATYPGRWLHVKTIAAQTVASASSNVKPLTTDTAGTAILAAVDGAWAILQSDGTNWVIMAAG